jgi:hypothetical protein
MMKDPSEQIADRLTVILGLTGLLREGAFGPLGPRQQQALLEVLQTAEELKTLLDPITQYRPTSI